MEAEILKLGGLGSVIMGVIFVVVKTIIKAVEKLYTDMQDQHRARLVEGATREDKLMTYLSQKNETDARVAQTLDNICTRLSNVECKVGKDVT